jgi:hypothetical protein
MPGKTVTRGQAIDKRAKADPLYDAAHSQVQALDCGSVIVHDARR